MILFVMGEKKITMMEFLNSLVDILREKFFPSIFLHVFFGGLHQFTSLELYQGLKRGVSQKMKMLFASLRANQMSNEIRVCEVSHQY